MSLHLSLVQVENSFNSNVDHFQVLKLHEEFFLPGEVILEQGTVVDQIYIVAHGCLVLFFTETRDF